MNASVLEQKSLSSHVTRWYTYCKNFSPSWPLVTTSYIYNWHLVLSVIRMRWLCTILTERNGENEQRCPGLLTFQRKWSREILPAIAAMEGLWDKKGPMCWEIKPVPKHLSLKLLVRDVTGASYTAHKPVFVLPARTVYISFSFFGRFADTIGWTAMWRWTGSVGMQFLYHFWF